ncbi:MAG: hypothetical protein Q8P67_04300 [archaeon]|nr:hypothetical protein [archaeon]
MLIESVRMGPRWILLLCFLVGVQSAPLPTTGVCLPFDSQPQACQFILNNASVWTLPSYGLTQEFWESLMVTPNPNTSFSVLGSVPAMPFDCATAYLGLMCPTFFRPCSSTGIYSKRKRWFFSFFLSLPFSSLIFFLFLSSFSFSRF